MAPEVVVPQKPVIFVPNTFTEQGAFDVFAGRNSITWPLPYGVTERTLGPPGECVPENPWPNPLPNGPEPNYSPLVDSRLFGSGMVPPGDPAGTFTDPNTGIVYAAYTNQMPAPKLLRDNPVINLGEPNRMLEALTGVSPLVKPERQEIVNDFCDAMEGFQYPEALLNLAVQKETQQRNARDMFFTNRETEAGYNDTHWDGYIGTTYVMRPTYDTQTISDNNESNTVAIPIRQNPDANLAIPMFQDGTEYGGAMQPAVQILDKDKVSGNPHVHADYQVDNVQMNAYRDSVNAMDVETLNPRKAGFTPLPWENMPVTLPSVSDGNTVDRGTVTLAAVQNDAQRFAEGSRLQMNLQHERATLDSGYTQHHITTPVLNMANLLAATDTKRARDAVASSYVTMPSHAEYVTGVPMTIAQTIGRDEVLPHAVRTNPVPEYVSAPLLSAKVDTNRVTAEHTVGISTQTQISGGHTMNVPATAQLSVRDSASQLNRNTYQPISEYNVPTQLQHSVKDAQTPMQVQRVAETDIGNSIRALTSSGMVRDEALLSRVVRADAGDQAVHANLATVYSGNGRDAAANSYLGHNVNTATDTGVNLASVRDSATLTDAYSGTLRAEPLQMPNGGVNSPISSDPSRVTDAYTGAVRAEALHQPNTAIAMPITYDGLHTETLTAPGRVGNNRTFYWTGQAIAEQEIPMYIQDPDKGDALLAADKYLTHERLLRESFTQAHPSTRNEAAEFRNVYTTNGRRKDECNPWKDRAPIDSASQNVLEAVLHNQLYNRAKAVQNRSEVMDAMQKAYESDIN